MSNRHQPVDMAYGRDHYHQPKDIQIEKIENNGPQYGNQGYDQHGHSSPNSSSENVGGEKMAPALTRETVHDSFNLKLLGALTAMSFLWIGSQIPLYFFGGVLPDVYGDIGGYDRWVWVPIAYFIPVAALCPFVGEFSDMFGRKWVGIIGQIFLVMGPVIVSTAQDMSIVIAGMTIAGAGAGLNELIALAATGEMVPTAKRGLYVGAVVITILPFAPSVVYAQYIVSASNWRYVGIFVAGWNLLGLIFLAAFYWPMPRPALEGFRRRDILRRMDWLGGFLSTSGIVCFMLGLQWGAQQYEWSSIHVILPFAVGVALLTAYVFWEIYGAKHPMVPGRIFSRARQTMIVALLITFLSGANFFNMLLFWPTEIYNVYGDDRTEIGIRSLPVGFGILIGAVMSLVAIPLTKGNVRATMLFFTAMMTAGAGATSIARPNNINAAYGPVWIACIGVGGVIIPIAIIAQIVCPDDLLGTITAISLSIRFVGGAIGFSVYYNVFYKHVYSNVFDNVALKTIIWKLGYIEGLKDNNIEYVTVLAQSIAQAQYAIFANVSDRAWRTPEVQARIPDVTLSEFRWQIVNATQWAMSTAYQWPYWISIPFGAACFILAFFLGDLSPYLDEHVAISL